MSVWGNAELHLQFTSMRPERFHPGNFLRKETMSYEIENFNEAGAFPPRKLRFPKIAGVAERLLQ